MLAIGCWLLVTVKPEIFVNVNLNLFSFISVAEMKILWNELFGNFSPLRITVPYMRHRNMKFNTCEQIAITLSSLA